jgi:putative spermidine/putrescine transport system ATP-binding protein
LSARTERADLAASAAPALRLSCLTGAYGRNVAVRGIDLEVAAGEFLTLLGPSGSGKTTTLRLIAGLLQPTSGVIELAGRDVTVIPPYRRDIGVVFQNYALFPHLTAGQNVAFPLEMRRVSRTDARGLVEKAFSLVQLSGYENRYPRQLSGGQQQRVALARALVFEPRLLLMDEPLGALDKKLRDQLQFEIKRIHQELGVTVVYVTHDQEEALVMSDRIAIFNDGKIAQIGSPQDIYRRPSSLFVADFIGEANVLTGSIQSRDGDVWLNTSSGSFRVPNPTNPVGLAPALVIRPERLQVVSSEEHDTNQETNAVLGTVKAVTYLGALVKYSITVGSMTLSARVEAPDDAIGWRPGDKVLVKWRRDDSVLMSDPVNNVSEATQRRLASLVRDDTVPPRD